jgi:hypothetical protein
MSEELFPSEDINVSAPKKNAIGSFCAWAGENPISFVMVLMVLLGGVSLVAGYREGFTAIVTGLFSWIKGTDKENQAKLVEATARADTAAKTTIREAENLRDSWKIHDQEVDNDALSAKANVENADLDELIDIGNSALAEHGALRDSEGA